MIFPSEFLGVYRKICCQCKNNPLKTYVKLYPCLSRNSPLTSSNTQKKAQSLPRLQAPAPLAPASACGGLASIPAPGHHGLANPAPVCARLFPCAERSSLDDCPCPCDLLPYLVSAQIAPFLRAALNLRYRLHRVLPEFTLKLCVCVLRRVLLFAISGTAARQTTLPVEFSRHDCCSGLPFPTPGSSRARDRTRASGVSGVGRWVIDC